MTQPNLMWSVTRPENGTTRATVEVGDLNPADAFLFCKDIFDVANGELETVTRWDNGTTQTTKKGGETK